MDMPLSAVVSLNVPDRVVIERLAQRGRADDDPGVVKKRLKVYHSETEPVLDYYRRKRLLKRVDAAGSSEDVNQQVQEVLCGH